MEAKPLAEYEAKTIGIFFDVETQWLLDRLCEMDQRNRSNMVARLVHQEAERRGLKPTES